MSPKPRRIRAIDRPKRIHPDCDALIYILDEPEAALSPQRQLTFLKIIHDLATPGHAQFLIATHSPIILSYPGAILFSLDGDAIQEIDYRETKHFLITRDFLNAPGRGSSSISSKPLKIREPMPPNQQLKPTALEHECAAAQLPMLAVQRQEYTVAQPTVF